MKDSAYKPDIDGLRAVAVLSVLLFHFGVSAFEGGFVGVDVFFVISGFLITRLIRNAVLAGQFSFGNFYVRRARRLFPAMFFTLAVTFVIACLLFSPQHLERLGGSTLYAILSVSNFYFWGESGYFDANSLVKPLLHFWSLSVEEQFYFIWPSLLVLLLTRFRSVLVPIVFITIAGTISVLLAQKWLIIDESAAFFLLPFRVVEFACGALLVWLMDYRFKLNWVNELILAIGLSMILYSVFLFKADTPFPGLYALIPCIGTALAIYAGNPRFLGKLISNKLMVYIGLISYSLYLCHWPIFVFTRYNAPNLPVQAVDVVWLTVVSFVVAVVMHRFVEVPFRYVSKEKIKDGTSARFGLVCALLALVLVFPAAHTWANKGWYWRLGSVDLSKVFDLDNFQAESIKFSRQNVLGSTFNNSFIKVLVVGDSHARDVSNGLFQVLDSAKFQVRIIAMDDACLRFLTEEGVVEFERLAKNPKNCLKQFNAYGGSNKLKNADILVFSAGFNPTTAGMIDRLIELSLNDDPDKSKKLIVMDRTVTFTGFHPEAIRLMSDGVGVDEINQIASKFNGSKLLMRVDAALAKNTAQFKNVSLIKKSDLLCKPERCSFFLDDGSLAVWDDTHWTVEAARVFMQKLLDMQPELFERL